MNSFKIQNLKFIIVWVSSSAFAQSLTLDQAIDAALKNNQLIRSAEVQVEYFKQMKKTGTEMGKFSAVWMHGQYNSVNQDNNINVMQTIPFPTALGSQVRLGKEHVAGAEKNLVASQNDLAFQVKTAYLQLVYQNSLHALLLTQDSLYADFAKASALRYKTGESNLLEKTTAETQLMDLRNQLHLNQADIRISETHLQALLKSEFPVEAADKMMKRPLPDALDSASIGSNPQLNYLKQQTLISQQFKRVEKNRLLPDIVLGYFNQTLIGVQNINGQDQFFGKDKRFQGFQLGVAMPLWFVPHVSKIKAAAYQEEVSRTNAEYYETVLGSAFKQALQELDKNQASLAYYEGSALKNANLILSQSKKAYANGEIGYVEYLQALKNSSAIRASYLNALNLYNQAVIKIEFLLGKF